MEINEKLNRFMEAVFMVALVGILIFASDISILSLGMIPILFTSYIFTNSFFRFAMIFVASAIVSFLYIDVIDSLILFGLLFLISLVFYLAIKYIKSDKKQIITGAIIFSLIFIGIYAYGMQKEGVSLELLAREVKEIFEKNLDYKLSLEVYKLSLSLYPSMLALLSFIYALFGLKLIRNYSSIKTGKYKDLSGINEIRIEKGDIFVIIGLLALIYCLSYMCKLNLTYVKINILLIIIEILALNGFSAYDYIIAKSNLPLSRGFQWFFIIILLQFLLVLFIILGFIDIILDVRKKRSLYEKQR